MWLPQLPAALHWDHNQHYHRWLAAQLPDRPERVLDAGCGSGTLAVAMAGRAGRVDAVDRSPDMIALARARWPHAANVRWLLGDLLDPGLPLAPEGYDAVTALSSLHHLDLHDGLTRLASLVRPGGVLAVVGLYRNETPADYAWEPVSMLANAAVGTARAARRRAGFPHPSDRPHHDRPHHDGPRPDRPHPGGPHPGGPRHDWPHPDHPHPGWPGATGRTPVRTRQPYDPGLPMRAPQDSLAEITAAARQTIPGARIRRRVFWRYTLAWHRPPD